MFGAIPGRLPILMTPFRAENPNFLNARSPYEWNCRFDRDFCNIRNEHNMALFSRHSDERSSMFGQNSMIFINVSIAGDFQAARLETEYFDTLSQPKACLSLTYLMYGTGAKKMYVIQQDTQNKCVWVDNNESIDTYGNWREAQLTINLRDGNPRFFIEAHIDSRPPNYGTLAISKIAFRYSECDYDNTNYCRAIEDQPNQPIPSAVS